MSQLIADKLFYESQEVRKLPGNWHDFPLHMGKPITLIKTFLIHNLRGSGKVLKEDEFKIVKVYNCQDFGVVWKYA